MPLRPLIAAAVVSTLTAPSAFAADLARLVEKAVQRGADSHPFIGVDAPDDPLTPPQAEPVDPRQPFTAWIMPEPSGLESIVRAGARAVNPGADATGLSPRDVAAVFPPREEWTLWAADSLINLARARALADMAAKIDRRARRAGAKTAMADMREQTKALRAVARERFTLTFGRKPPHTLRWRALNEAKAQLPRTQRMAVDLAMAASPGLSAAAPVGDPEASYGRMRMQNLGGITGFNSALGGAVGADGGVALGVKLKLGFVPGGMSYDTAPGRDAARDRVVGRNAVKRLLVDRIAAAYDARRAAQAHLPILAHREKRLGALLDGYRKKNDADGAAEAARKLWIDAAAKINATYAEPFAAAIILAGSGRLFDALYGEGDVGSSPAQSAAR